MKSKIFPNKGCYLDSFCFQLLFLWILFFGVSNSNAFLIPNTKVKNVIAIDTIISSKTKLFETLDENIPSLIGEERYTNPQQQIRQHRNQYQRLQNGRQQHQNHQQQQQQPPPQHPRQNYTNNNLQNNREHSNTPRNGQGNAKRVFNNQIVECESAMGILNLLAERKGALTKVAGGNSLSSINFATAFHRIARHLQQASNNNRNTQYGGEVNPNNQRKIVLSDPRFALFVCGTAEALSKQGSPTLEFTPREMSNIAWAISKLRIAPPDRAYPMDLSLVAYSKAKHKCAETREKIYQVARDRAGNNNNGSLSTPSGSWVPAVSELCGIIMDIISYQVRQEENPFKFQLQEWANLLYAVVTCQRVDPQVAENIVQKMIQRLDRSIDEAGSLSIETKKDILQPQNWSNSLWSLATASIFGPDEKSIPFVCDLMETYPDFLKMFKSQELSNTAWGVATLLSKRPTPPSKELSTAGLSIIRAIAKEVAERKAVKFKSQELSNTAWAFATIGFGLTQNEVRASDPFSANDYMVLSSDDPDGDKEIMIKAMEGIILRGHQILQYFRSQELNNMAWAMARLGRKDEHFLLRLGRELCNPRRRVDSQDTSTTIWALASLEYFDKELYTGIAYRFIQLSSTGQTKPQEHSITLWSLATGEVIPEHIDVFDTTLVPANKRISPQKAKDDIITYCFGICAQDLMARPFEYKAQEIKDLLWAFSKAGVRHPKLFKAVAEHLVGKAGGDPNNIRGLDQFSPQGTGNLAWAYARQCQIGSEDTMNRLGRDSTIAHTSGRLAIYTASSLDLGENLHQRLFAAIAETNLRVHYNLSWLKPQDLSNTAWSFALQGFKHDKFFQEGQNRFLERIEKFVTGQQRDVTTHFKPQEITNFLWAVATVNADIVPNLLSTISPFLLAQVVNRDTKKLTVESIAQTFKRQELANLAWACAVFGQYPPDLIQLVYMGLLGVGSDISYSPKELEVIFDDDGLQASAMMALTYLQTTMDLEGENVAKVALPQNFPQDWFTSISKYNDGLSADGLRLHVSKIQSDVSNAFSRIGFDHVPEHVITMESLVTDYGVNMCGADVELMSIDIANLESKIGIEVDGPAHFVACLNEVSVEPPTIDDAIADTANSECIVNSNGYYEYEFSTWNRRTMNGATTLKNKILRELGWKIINIPYWEWHAMNGDPEKEDEFCRSLLQ